MLLFLSYNIQTDGARIGFSPRPLYSNFKLKTPPKPSTIADKDNVVDTKMAATDDTKDEAFEETDVDMEEPFPKKRKKAVKPYITFEVHIKQGCDDMNSVHASQ